MELDGLLVNIAVTTVSSAAEDGTNVASVSSEGSQITVPDTVLTRNAFCPLREISMALLLLQSRHQMGS